jgi:hypothetical protein
MIGQAFGAKKDESGMTSPRQWPTNADKARMDCISKARRIALMLDKLLDHVTSPEDLRTISRINRVAAEIEITLIEVRHIEKGENDHE